ncbi:MAG: DUF6785 family protein [Armatimonadota bacterium]|nr:DUF6785 family protein [Armatimonadota bacterium]
MAQRLEEVDAPRSGEGTAPRRLHLRTFVLALAIVVLSVKLSVHQRMVQSAGAQVDYALAVLLVMVLLEPVIEPLLSMGRRSYLYIYVATLVGVGVYDGVSRFLPVYTAAQYFDAPGNNYGQIAETYPSWFIPKDPELIRQFYEGATGPVDLTPWLPTIGVWTAFFCVLWGTLLCICILLRRHWVEDERLAFPLVQVPLYITGFGRTAQTSDRSIWQQPLMWTGFGLVTVHFITIMIHAANPSMPTLGPRYDLGQFFTEYPLDALARHFLFIHNPHLVGLAYFAPQDICFSMFFFFFLIKLLMLVYRVGGLHEPSGFPFFWEQAAGAFVGIAIYYTWSGREYLAKLWRNIVAGPDAPGAAPRDPDAPLSYRLAAGGAVSGFIILCVWYIAAGMTWWIPLVFFGLIVLFATIFTRGRAEAGIGSLASFPFWQASRQIKSFLGTRPLAPGGDYTNLSMLASLIFLHFGTFPETMTFQIEGLKISQDARLSAKGLTGLMSVALVLGLLAMMWLSITVFYEWGGNTLSGGVTEGGYHVRITIDQLSDVSSVIEGNHRPVDRARNAFTIGALLFTLLLVMIRLRWLRFPLHPLGWVMTLPYGYAYWGPFFAAWLVKWGILKFGGMRLYNALIPFFIGLIVGQIFSLSILWQVVAVFMPERWRALADPLSYF